MCGIAGLISYRPSEVKYVDRMLAAIEHRGPDGKGVWQSPANGGLNVVLGHRRLSILDLSDAGAQPMVDNSGEYVLTYNGELYNYLEIRKELEKYGVEFRSHSDTEVVLEAYKKWGRECLQRFNGMFAFALYDQRKGKLFCARDRYGEKPFLFSTGNDFFIFASEYKAILQYPEISLDLEETRLLRAAYREGSAAGLDTQHQTVFSDVQQLLPSEAMEVDLHSLDYQVWTYWQIEPSEVSCVKDEGSVFEEFRELLIDSVRLRLRSDVPVGSCLSGGLDSSAIICIVRMLQGDKAPYNTFTARFPGTSADEWEHAQKVIEATGSIPHTVEPTVDMFLDEIDDFLWYNELPVGSSSQYAQWCVYRLAKQQNVTVLLDGQGADELLGGYPGYFRHYVKALQETGREERLKKELPVIRERYPAALSSFARKKRDQVPFIFRYALCNRLGLGSNFLFGLNWATASAVLREKGVSERKGCNTLTGRLIDASFGGHLTQLMRYGDRNSMAHSRETRLPFCDHRLAEFVFRLPPELLMGEIQTKRLLRESLRGILPEQIRTRWDKVGFRPPQEQWFESPRLKEMIHSRLASSSFRENGVWDYRWWEHIINRFEKGEKSLATVLWRPFIVEAWKASFVDRIRDQRAN